MHTLFGELTDLTGILMQLLKFISHPPAHPVWKPTGGLQASVLPMKNRS